MPKICQHCGAEVADDAYTCTGRGSTNLEDAPKKQIRKGEPFYTALHRALVILDDWLCEEYGFSRKARGKYLTV